MTTRIDMFSRLLMLITAVTVVSSGVASDSHHSQMLISLTGSVLIGLLAAIRIRFPSAEYMRLRKQLEANMKEAQRLYRNSDFALYRKVIYGIDSSNSEWGRLGIAESLEHPLAIFTALSVGVVIWFSPSFFESNFATGPQMLKSSGAHFLAFAFISIGLAGVFLNVIGWLKPKE